MTDNVIQLGSRKTLAEVQQQEAIAAEKALTQLSEKQAEIKKLTLASIDAVRKMVEDDQMGGLVIITQNLADRLFLSDIVIQREVTPPAQLFAWTGILEALKLEIAAYATMSPQYLIDGTISDPELPTDDPDEDEEFEE